MILIVCVDDKRGMAFNSRRQSRDSVVYSDIARFAKDKTLGMNERSEMLFEGLDVITTTDITKSDIYFAEFECLKDKENTIDEIIIYRWNRHYPADTYFDINLDNYKKIETTDFIGSSHEKITKEIYIREKK